jgi:hypothetical protein
VEVEVQVEGEAEAARSLHPRTFLLTCYAEAAFEFFLAVLMASVLLNQ